MGSEFGPSYDEAVETLRKMKEDFYDLYEVLALLEVDELEFTSRYTRINIAQPVVFREGFSAYPVLVHQCLRFWKKDIDPQVEKWRRSKAP